MVADVNDESQVRAMVDRAMDAHSRLDILHNNASLMRTDQPDADLTELPLEVWERQMAVNARGVMLGCKYGVAAMRRSGRGGSIVNTASVSGLLGVDENASYGASKAAVIGLTRYVASMYGAEGIRCNAVAPGPIVTEHLAATLSEHRLAEHAAKRLLAWATTPADVAAVGVFLLGDDARCITGQTIVVDGGTIAHRPRHATQAWDRAGPGRSPDDSQWSRRRVRLRCRRRHTVLGESSPPLRKHIWRAYKKIHMRPDLAEFGGRACTLRARKRLTLARSHRCVRFSAGRI